ncbi:MAG: cobU [Firmicutes bacterium]|nr:cobU [Bacillota bacterium]
MTRKLVLVTGGARSGKSTFAEQYAARLGEKVEYIATAEVGDEEMRTRVALHRQRRPDNWRTTEAPYDAAPAMREAALRADVVLFDCLTLYTSNLLLAPGMPEDPLARSQAVLNRWKEVLAAAAAGTASVIIVSNEVGCGIVPDNALAREYRDLSGFANQLTAKWADEVYWTICGLAIDAKKIAVNGSWD